VTLPVVDLDLTDAFGHLRIVPVVVIHDAQDAEPLALALKAGGLARAVHHALNRLKERSLRCFLRAHRIR
jgi:hypothetical protein